MFGFGMVFHEIISLVEQKVFFMKINNPLKSIPLVRTE